MIDPTLVKDFVKEHKERFGQDVWIVGEVKRAQDKANPKAIIREDFELIDINKSFLQD